VHVPTSLAATCQPDSISLKPGRNSYIRAENRSLIGQLQT
jgi:hypothetical protein